MTARKVEIAPRPYLMQPANGGGPFLMSSVEIERLVAAYPIKRIASATLVLEDSEGDKIVIRPATIGGGPAFKEVR